MRITTPLNDQEQSSQDSPRKMFVGGLSWLTTPDHTNDRQQYHRDSSYFKYSVNHLRGFGFITFQDSSSVDKVLSQEKHFLDEKQMVTKTRKAFVGGLSSSTTEQQLRDYFSRFGEVEEVSLMYDKSTLRHRGFAFVTFASEEACDDVVNLHFHEINERRVECKKAQPKEFMWAHNYNKSKNSLSRSHLSDILGGFPLPGGYPVTVLTRPINFAPYAFANCYEFPFLSFEHVNQAIPSAGLTYIQAAPPTAAAAISTSDRNAAVFEMLNPAAMTGAPNTVEFLPFDNPLASNSFISRPNAVSQNFFTGPVYSNGFH